MHYQVLYGRRACLSADLSLKQLVDGWVLFQ